MSVGSSRCAAIRSSSISRGMRCCVAQPQQSGDLGQLADQPAEAPIGPVQALAVPGIHVLPQKRDLLRTLRHQPARLRDHRRRRTAGLGAARIRHNAERAEFVATLLDREEGGQARRGGRVGQEVELILGREIRLDDGSGRPAARATISGRR